MSLGWEGPHFEINHLIVTRKAVPLEQIENRDGNSSGKLTFKVDVAGLLM